MRLLMGASLAIVGCAPVAVAQEAEPLALPYAAAQARLLDQSDAIEAASANVRSKEAQEGSTRTLARPDVDIEAQLLQYQKTLYLPLGSLAPVAERFGIRSPLRFQREETAVRPIVTATLPLYAGGQIRGTQQGAKAQVAQARAERDGAIDEAIVQLVRAYYGQQLAERALGIRRDVLAGLNRHVADAEKLEKERFISRAQRLQAEVARDEAAREFEKAISDLATANAALSGILRAPDGVRPVTPLAVDADPLPPLATFKTAAAEAHPQLARFKAIGEQADAGVKLQQAKQRPTVYGFGQYNFDRRDALLTDPDWTVGIGLKYKLAGGLGRNQAVAAARYNVAQAEAGLREARVQVEIGVTKAWHEAEAARKRFLLLDSAEVAAAENLKLQSLSFRELQSTSLDVVDAELGLGRARIQRAQAANEYIQALAQLLSMSGQADQMPNYLARADKVIP